MSAGDENVFTRWSRRKQAVRYGETSAADEEKDAFEVTEGEAKPADELPTPVETHSEDPLPSLDDLTAESDLSGFLRKGVPEALKSAALRKIWSLDPAIRDHVGPSEYAWDFNQPGSMAGFGPLNAGETAADFLSTMSGGTQAGVGSMDAPSECPQSPRKLTDVPSELHLTETPDNAASPTEQADLPNTAARLEPLALARAKVAAEPEDSGNALHAITRRRHGGAMPR